MAETVNSMSLIEVAGSWPSIESDSQFDVIIGERDDVTGFLVAYQILIGVNTAIAIQLGVVNAE